MNEINTSDRFCLDHIMKTIDNSLSKHANLLNFQH